MQGRKGSVEGKIVFIVAALFFVIVLLLLAPARENLQNKSQLNLAQQELLQEVNKLRQPVAKELVLIQSSLSGKNSIPEKDLQKADLLSRTAIQLLMAEGYVLNENLADAERYLKSAKEKWTEYEFLITNK